MRLPAEEPAATAWRSVTDDELRTRLRQLLPEAGSALVLVDGRSGSGKSTVAARLARLLGAPLVHTDDIAWHHDPIEWAGLLVDGVLEPWRRGEPVRYRPPGWIARDRAGAVCVDSCSRLVVEGVGAARAELAERAELAVWVQADVDVARRRGVARDVELGRTPAEAEAFWDDWARAEDPFLAIDQPWRRARLIVNGAPLNSAGDVTVIADGPLP